MYKVSINNDLSINTVFDTDIYIPVDETTYPITEAEKDMIWQSNNMALWQYKDGVVVASEQASEIEKFEYNQKQKKYRVESYQLLSDPIFMKWQRQEATQEEWLAKIAEIKTSFPYQE